MPRRPLITAALAALALLAAWVQPAAAGSARAELRAGFNALRLGDKDGAAYHLDRALASGELRGEELGTAYMLRGDVLRERRRYDKAVADYDRALRAYGEDAAPARLALLLRRRGQAHYSQGRYDQAIADLDRALRHNPRDPLAYYWRASAWRLEGRYRKALDDLDRAIRLRRHPRFYYRRSQVLMRLGQVSRAVADMQTAVELAPGRREYRARLEYLRSLPQD